MEERGVPRVLMSERCTQGGNVREVYPGLYLRVCIDGVYLRVCIDGVYPGFLLRWLFPVLS